MNSGKSSNCVHWSYAVETGTSTSIDLVTDAIWVIPQCNFANHSTLVLPRIRDATVAQLWVAGFSQRAFASVSDMLAAVDSAAFHDEPVTSPRDPARAPSRAGALMRHPERSAALLAILIG